MSDEELEEQLKEEAENSGYKSVDDFKAEIDTEAYREYLLVEKMMDYLAEMTAD